MALVDCPECGKEVSSTAESCPNCGFNVKEHFLTIKNAEIQNQNEIIRQEKRQNNIKKLKIIVPILILIIGGSLGIIINNHILSKRTVFKSEDEMIAYLSQYNNWEYDNQYTDECLMFHDSGFAEVLSKTWSRGRMAVYHPKRGKFSIGIGDYFISNTGDIIRIEKNKEDKHYKASNFSTLLESAGTALSVEVAPPALDENGHFQTTVKVKNKGKNAYRFIQLKTQLTSDSNQIYSPEDEFSMVRNTESSLAFTLRPGDTGECEIGFFITDKNFNLGSGQCTVSIVEYDTELSH